MTQPKNIGTEEDAFNIGHRGGMDTVAVMYSSQVVRLEPLIDNDIYLDRTDVERILREMDCIRDGGYPCHSCEDQKPDAECWLCGGTGFSEVDV